MTRHFSESVAIRLRNAARRAARSRRTNKAEGCITGTNHKARRSFVPGVGSRLQLCLAKTPSSCVFFAFYPTTS